MWQRYPYWRKGPRHAIGSGNSCRALLSLCTSTVAASNWSLTSHRYGTKTSDSFRNPRIGNLHGTECGLMRWCNMELLKSLKVCRMVPLTKLFHLLSFHGSCLLYLRSHANAQSHQTWRACAKRIDNHLSPLQSRIL